MTCQEQVDGAEEEQTSDGEPRHTDITEHEATGAARTTPPTQGRCQPGHQRDELPEQRADESPRDSEAKHEGHTEGEAAGRAGDVGERGRRHLAVAEQQATHDRQDERDSDEGGEHEGVDARGEVEIALGQGRSDGDDDPDQHAGPESAPERRAHSS